MSVETVSLAFLTLIGAFGQLSSAQQANLVPLNIRYNDGTLLTSRIPIEYLTDCRVNGRPLKAGQTVNIAQDMLPSCVTSGMQRYAQDLQTGLRTALQQLQSASDTMSQGTGGIVTLDLSVLTKELSSVLQTVGGKGGLLDVARVLNTLQPVTKNLFSTLSTVQGLLGGVSELLGGASLNLSKLLGGLVGMVGGIVRGLGSNVGGLGNVVETLGSVVRSTGEALLFGLASSLDDVRRLLASPA